MILTKAYLHPFAGIEDQTVSFEQGLNVLLGPNEAGKSTVFHAVMHGLLTTTSLTRTKVEDKMGSYFPAVGGDVIRVELELENAEGNAIHINKAWKKGNRNGRASLKLPDGTEITDEKEVQQTIESLLPVSPATMRTIMLANQSGLYQTIQKMEDAGKVRRELGEILRQSFMETGGVSVDRFSDRLEQKYNDYFKRWDRQQQYPNNNRGIKNPYKTGPNRTGKVIEAFYKKEQFRLDLQEANRFEDELDGVNESLNALLAKQKKKEEKYEQLNPLKEGMQDRQLKEQKLEAVQEKKERLLHISQKWPVYKDKIENLDPKLEEKRDELEALQEEQKKAQNKQEAKQLKQQIEKIEKIKTQIKTAKEKLNDAKKITQEELNELQELQADIRQYQTKIEAAKLTIRITSDDDRTLRYSEAGADEQDIEAENGETLNHTASGGFTLKTDGLKIEVFSGEGDLESTISKLQTKNDEFSGSLEQLEAENLQEAKTQAQIYQKQKNNLKQVEQTYKNELGDKEPEDLKEKLEEYGDLSDVRSAEEITEDMVETKTALNKLNEDAEAAKEKIDQWKDKYDSSEEVILELAETSKLLKELESDLEELPSLPEGYETSQEFISEVEQLGQDIQQLKEQTFEKKQQRTQLQADAPEASSEELKKLLDESEAEFERINQKAEALAKVKEKSTELIETMDSDTYKGLEENFLQWLNRMVGERFSAVDMDSDIPTVFSAQNEADLGYQLLSHGTKDTVALAWRFALSEKFLGEETGFIILDDPMVDIDPERRKEVVKAINEFSTQYQTLVMTCHPSHAEELGDDGKVAMTQLD